LLVEKRYFIWLKKNSRRFYYNVRVILEIERINNFFLIKHSLNRVHIIQTMRIKETFSFINSLFYFFHIYIMIIL
jgi:hypothetical protein